MSGRALFELYISFLKEVCSKRPPIDEVGAIVDEEDILSCRSRCLQIHDEQIYKLFVLQLYLYR